jgi:2-polyprenyl-3-methyl-5-hydroxy-6-metoxy-1,4-benzoquinol methylase
MGIETASASRAGVSAGMNLAPTGADEHAPNGPKSTAAHDIERGERFGFGANWTAFLEVLDDDRIREAERSLRAFLGVEDLTGRRFLDIGCGSGLFSLAARRLGATVHSFDYDESSVGCARELKRRYHADEAGWTIEHGSVLDRDYVESLGKFDVCYSWGVLHHTDHLWKAIFNAQLPVAHGGRLFIAVYNDEGIRSAVWEAVKRNYCAGPVRRAVLTAVFFTLFFLAGLAIDVVKLRNPARRFAAHRHYRGMSLTHDWRDWLGGYPYERARPERVRAFVENLGYRFVRMERPDFGFGNNQFLFVKDAR